MKLNKKLKYFLPETMSKSQEKWVLKLTDRLVSAGWPEHLIQEWWQTPMYELSNFCPLEAVCADKFKMAELSLDKTIRTYGKLIYEIEEDAKAMKKELLSDDNVYDIKVDEIDR